MHGDLAMVYATRWPQVLQWTIDLKMCNRCANLSRSGMLNKINSFSWIDLTLVF